jgi:hypothetical protein
MAKLASLTSVWDCRAIRSWPTDFARQWLHSFLRRVRGDPNVLVVVAIGSSVRTASADDLDLVVLCKDRTLQRDRPPIEVDLRAFDWDKVDADIQRGKDLLIWAVRFGEPLYDPAGRWQDLVSRWKGRMPLPNPEEAIGRAEAALADFEKMRAAGDTDAMQDLNLSYLTHLARARLTAAGVFPASRPELPDQLRQIGQAELAESLGTALALRARIGDERPLTDLSGPDH